MKLERDLLLCKLLWTMGLDIMKEVGWLLLWRGEEKGGKGKEEGRERRREGKEGGKGREGRREGKEEEKGRRKRREEEGEAIRE
jgi:hypothetical protein